MADTFLVRLARGLAWDHSLPRREQSDWDAHAAFMDALAAERFVVLGGPVGEGDGDDACLVVSARDETAIAARLDDDPWSESLPLIDRIERWSVWLGRLASPTPTREGSPVKSGLDQ